MRELSRPTVMSYIDAMEITQVIAILRPYHDGGRQELVRQPKILWVRYGIFRLLPRLGRFATRGLRCPVGTDGSGDAARNVAGETVCYWRDKQQHEVDFVLPAGRGVADAIECKWSASAFVPSGLRALRASHPRGRNFVVGPSTPAPITRRLGNLEVTTLSLPALVEELR